MIPAFDSRNSIKTQSKDVASRKIASEQDLAIIQRTIVETPVTKIVTHLNTQEDVCNEFRLAGGIHFDNHLNTLSDDADGVQQLEPSTPPRAAHSRYQNRPDQICVYTTVAGTNKPALIVEYKAPHKLTCDDLRHILRPNRPTLELERVINRPTMPSPQDIEAYFEYRAERLVAAVITQAFSYMVLCGTQYGYVTIGEAFIFLCIKPDQKAKTLYYHLAEPSADVNAQKQDSPGTKGYVNRTAISQVLAFRLLALKSAQAGQEWREGVIKSLST